MNIEEGRDNSGNAPNSVTAPNTVLECHDNRTKAQKSVPASLLKQLRATAAVICYDYLFGQPTMPATEFQRKLYNMYHGNEDLNIASQLDLMLAGKNQYSEMYKNVQTLNISNNADVQNDSTKPIANELALSPVLLNFDNHIRYVCGEHFNSAMLRCPTKTLTKEFCTGRFLLDLCKQAVANIKKASILADQWLINNETPSGTVWEDLYKHLLENSNKINAKEKVFTGMAAFICFSKYNEGGENHLNILAKNDEEAVSGTDSSRSQSRLQSKNSRDKQRSLDTGTDSVFNTRGLTLDSKMQMVEIAQFEDAQARDDMKNDLEMLTNRNKLLLTEREQEINLAKIICPQYDESNMNWKRVMELGREIATVNKEMLELQKKKSHAQSKQVGKSMAAKFLASVRGNGEMEIFGENLKKRSIDSLTDGTEEVCSIASPPKRTITVNDDESSTTSSLNTGHISGSDRDSSVSLNNQN